MRGANVGDSFFSPDLFYVHLGIVTCVGFFFGSFLNVCIYRIPAGLSIALPGSHCLSCGTPIRWYDNIPLLSYLHLRGKCRYCGSIFSVRYFIVELLTGILFGLTFFHFRYTLATPVYIVFVCLLIVATFTDLDHWIIPDGVTIYGTLFALAAAFLAGFYPKGFIIAGAWPFYQSAFYSPLANALTGAAAGALLIYAIGAAGSVAFRKEAMGFGDVKLFLLLGAMLGVMNCVYVLTLASCIGSLVGGSMILVRKVSEHRARRRGASGDSGDNASECGKGHEQADAGIYEQGDSTQPQPTLEDEIFQKIVSAYQTVGAKTKAALPGVHHIPFGPYIAVAAIIVLYLGERIHNYFFGMW